MPEEMKRCPFCGGEAFSSEGITFGYHDDVCGIFCSKCGGGFLDLPSSATNDKKMERIKEEWNRRTPEPGTSILRWTRYDGTPETLPEEGKEVIVKGEKFLPFCLWEGHWIDCTDFFARDFNVGDEWAYLPERDE